MTEEPHPATNRRSGYFLFVGVGYLLVGLIAGIAQIVRGAGLNAPITCLYLALGLFWLWYWRRSDRRPLP